MFVAAYGQRRTLTSRICWLQLSFNCSKNAVTSRGVGNRLFTSNESPATDPDTKTTPLWPTATWIGSKSSKQVPDSIVSQLPQLDFPKHSTLSTTVFLATPTFADIFSDGGTFHKDAMNKIYGSFSPECSPSSVVAIVDALPSSKTIPRTTTPQSVFEGIAMCIRPDLSINAESQKSLESSHIRFYQKVNRSEDSLSTTISYKLPVANTLFLNGQQSTMFRQAWSSKDRQNAEQDGAHAWQYAASPEYLNNLEISLQAFTENSGKALHLKSHLQPLTVPQRISSHMGNVIRKIETQDGSIESASAELEKVVPAFIKEHSAEQAAGSIRVYALVMSQELVTTFTNSDPSSVISKTKADPFIAHLIRKGASLHRVTSGGGGWGSKQGLLSLEPAIDLNQSTADETDSPLPDLDMDTVAPPKPKNLFPEDHMIQFFAHFQPPPVSGDLVQISGNNIDTSAWSSDQWVSKTDQAQMKRKIILGTTLGKNSGDTISSKDTSNPEQSSTDNAKPPALVSIPYLFGMVTTGPISFSSTTTALNSTTGESRVVETSQSLIDVPDVFFESLAPRNPYIRSRNRNPSAKNQPHKRDEDKAGRAKKSDKLGIGNVREPEKQ